MASYSIVNRKGKFCCQVRWYDGSGNRGSKSRSFSKRSLAKSWGDKIVAQAELDIIDVASGRKNVLFGELIDMYLNDEHVSMGRSKRYSLLMVRDCDISNINVSSLKPRDFVDFCKDRKSAGAGPSTVAGDISYLRALLKSAQALYDVDVDATPIIKAMPTLHALNLIGKSQIRSRRPTIDEVVLLKEGLLQHSSQIPYVDILEFSILSCMRVGEVCSITWEDLNVDEAWVWVRDRKDPRKKVGNHMKVPLLGGALDIVLRQERIDDPRIFPFNSRSVTAGFRRVRNSLGIHDLRYHDLRREGASRLLEKGYPIERVAQVTGHRDLNTLWRIYVDLFPDKNKRV